MDNTAKQEVQLGQTPAEEPKIQLGQPTLPPTSTDTASKRSDLWSFAKITDKDPKDLTNGFVSGQEVNLRQEAATNNNIKKLNAIRKDPPKNIQDLYNAMIPTDPSWFPESAISQKYFLNLPESVDRLSGSDWAKLYKNQPEVEAYLRRSGTGVGSIHQILETAQKDNDDVLKSRSTLGAAYSAIRDFAIPILPNIRETGLPIFPSSVLNRDQLELYSLPPKEAKAFVKQRQDSMPPEQFKHWVEYMNNYHNSSEILMSNLGSIADLAATPGALGGIKVMGSMIKGMERLATGAVGSAGIATSAAVGDMKKAAVEAAKKEIIPEVTGKGFTFDFSTQQKKLEDGLFSGFVDRKETVYDPAQWADREVRNRLLSDTESYGEDLKFYLNNMRNVSRMDLETSAEKLLEAGYELAANEGWYKGPGSMLLDIGKTVYHNLMDSYYQPFALGTPKGLLYDNEAEALAWAKNAGVDALQVYMPEPTKTAIAAASWEGRPRPKGAGWYNVVWKPVNERENILREAIKLNNDNEYQEGILSHLFDWWRNPDELLSNRDNWNRKTAVYGGSFVMDLLESKAQKLKALGFTKSSIDPLQQVLAKTQFLKDPASKDPRPGHFPLTPYDVESLWHDVTGRFPTLPELQAYHDVRELYEADYALRNIAIYKMLHRLGAEQVSIKAGKFQSDFFNAVKVNKIPGEGNVLLAHYGNKPEHFDTKNFKDIVFNERSKLKDVMKNNGVTIYELVAPHIPSLSKIPAVGDNMIRYVVMKNKDVKPLAPLQMPYRGGIHVMPQYKMYAKAAQVIEDKLGRTQRYIGDTTYHGVTNRAEGERWVKIHNEALAARKAGDRALEEKLVPQLGYKIKEWDDDFKTTRGRDGRLNYPHRHVDHPAAVLDSGIKYIDSAAGQYLRESKVVKDSYKEGNMYLQHVVEFSQMRDAEDFTSLVDRGSQQNPAFELQKAQYLSPLESLARGLTRIARSVVFDSLKIQGMENFLAEGIKAGVFGAKPKDIYNAPLAFFANPKWATGIKIEDLNKFKSRWMTVKSINGMGSDIDKWTSSWAQKLHDMVYRVSPKVNAKLYDWLGTWELGGTRDPLKFARNIAFHKSLGMFNPAQFIIHASAGYNIGLIAGMKASIASGVGLLYTQWARINNTPEILAHLDELASKWGSKYWNKGEFTESLGGLFRSGFMHERGTYVLNPETITNNLVPSMTHKAFNAGTIFFRGGVQHLKIAAWHAAYHEARHGDKYVKGGVVGKFSEKDWGWVTERASMLSHNMDRASSSFIEQNPLYQTAFQFTTYFKRLAEITLGKRLNHAERARLIAGNAIMYGIPITATMSLLPVSDWMQKTAQENGYQVGNNAMSDFVMQGLPAMLSTYVLGYPLDFGERFGSKSPFQNLIVDETMWDLGFGVVGSTFQNLFHAFSPFMGAFLSIMPGSTEDERWPINSNTVWTVAREITALNAGFELASIVRTGQWITKKGRLVESDIPIWAGAFMGLTGVRSLQQHQMYEQVQQITDDKKYQQAVLGNALEHYNKGMRAAEQGNESQADEEFRAFRAHFVFMNQETIREAVKAGAKTNKDQISQVRESYWNLKRKPISEQVGDE